MLNLENKITLNAKSIGSPNLCDSFTDADLKNIGSECWSGYYKDDQSRAHWMKRNEAGMDLALQIQREKTFPWPGCANVAFPLVTIAAMQFHARAYPAIVNGDQIVKCHVFAEDPTGQVTARGDRVSTHMSWQLMYQDRCWEDQEDKSILNLSIVGTNFKKTYYSASLKHNVSDLVLAKDLVINYWAKSVENCNRKTHKLPKFRNEVHENVMRGIWRDCLSEQWYIANPLPASTTVQTRQDNRQGVTPPQPDDATTFIFCEQHCDLDLDNDGYAEPYVVTFEERSKFVVRIVTRFDSEKAIERVAVGPRKGNIIRIEPVEYFTKRTFIPSPDGGIYDIGFGVFLGPLNEAVNSLVNMLLDAGTMQTTAGGFLARGAKIRGGVYTVAPFEWKRVDSTGDDLRKSVFPLPANQPSDVLFKMLGLLIDYTSRISGTTDITVGENPGQNTPAQTTQTMVEMGQKIYTAIFKRIWRSSKEEFRKLHKLNSVFLPLDIPQVGGATRMDYQMGEDSVMPVADPNISSDSMRLQLALTLKSAAATTPGYNKDEVERRFLKALHVDGVKSVFKGTEGLPPQKDPALIIEETKIQGAMQIEQLRQPIEQGKLAVAQQEANTKAQLAIMQLQEEQRLNNAKINELTAKAAEAAANAQSEQAYAQVAMINAELSRAKHENDHINAALERETKHFLAKLEAETRLQEAAMTAAAKKVVDASKGDEKPAQVPKLPDIHVHMPSGKKKITAPDGRTYTSEDA